MKDWGFPLIQDLPIILTTKGWRWQAFPGHRYFWIGIDTCSISWLIKQKGTWNAVREHIYAGFAQTLGICTQSSAYLSLDKSSMPLQGDWHPDKSPHNVGIWKFEEHADGPCCRDCPLRALKEANTTDARMKAWFDCGITNPWDKVEARFLGYLCGMFEPTQSLITTSHQWVQIDNELTFSSWLSRESKAYENAIAGIQNDPMFSIEGAPEKLSCLLSRISDVTDEEIDRLTLVPDEFRCRTVASRIQSGLRRLRRKARSGLGDYS